MEDERVWHHEKLLWTGSPEDFAGALDDASLVVVPAAPFLLEGRESVQQVAKGPRFREVTFAHGKVARPQEGLIVAAYKAYAVDAQGEDYHAWCTTTYRRIGHDDWHVVQHQQTSAAEGPLRGG